MRGIVFLLLFLSLRAEAYIEANVFYLTDALSYESTTAESKMYFDVSFGFRLDKKGDYLLGWNIVSITRKDDTDTTTSYASSDMGIKFTYFFDKAHTWGIGVNYNLMAKATFSTNNGDVEEWRGTSYKAEVGYSKDVAEDFFVGLRMNYYAAQLGERIVGQTTLSKVSYTRTFIYPSIYIGYGY